AGGSQLCVLHVFDDDVECSSSDWQCYGSGPGYDYQKLAKSCPQFAVEAALLGMRKRRQHWGPLNRYEVEVMPEAEDVSGDRRPADRANSASVKQWDCAGQEQSRWQNGWTCSSMMSSRKVSHGQRHSCRAPIASSRSAKI